MRRCQQNIIHSRPYYIPIILPSPLSPAVVHLHGFIAAAAPLIPPSRGPCRVCLFRSHSWGRVEEGDDEMMMMSLVKIKGCGS